MDVSIIIVTRNTCELTCAAIRSVQESQDHLSKEIIVVDNGSTDNTRSVLARDFPDIKYHRFECNLGFARANNAGAQDARGDFLLLLNSDARLNPNSLASAVLSMRGHKHWAVAGAQLLNSDGSRQNSIANFPSLATELLNKSLLRRLFPSRFPGKEITFEEPVEVESVIGAFFLTRKEVWQDLGGFDERFFFFFEETDFCLQVSRRNYKIFHLPHVQVWHDQGKSAGQSPAAARIEFWRSRYLYFLKNHRPGTVFLLRLGLPVRLLIDFAASFAGTIFTLGQSPPVKKKLKIYSALLLWHCQGCPAGSGLAR